MKNSLKFIVFFFLIIFCTGCVKFQETMDIRSNKSLHLKVLFALDQSIYNQDVFTDDEISRLKQNGYQLKEYKEGNYKGYLITYSIPNIDKVSSTSFVSYSLTDMKRDTPKELFQVKKHFFFHEYFADFTFDATDVSPSVSYENNDLKEYLCDDGSVIEIDPSVGEIPSNCHDALPIEIENAKSDKPLSEEELEQKIAKDNELDFIVKLRSKVIDSNADTVKNHELLWSLKDNGVTNIQFSFVLYNWGKIILIGMVVLLILIGILFLLKKCFFKEKKKKK